MSKNGNDGAAASERRIEADFSAVLGIITRRRDRATVAVNAECTMAYWEIGAFLSRRIRTGSWDTAIVGRLADYIKRNEPALRGYGKSNLYGMASVYDAFASDEFSALLEREGGNIRELAALPSELAAEASVPQIAATSAAAASHADASAPSPNRDIFQPAVGKSLPPVLLLTTYTNLLLIVNHCDDARERLFYILHAHRERLTKRELLKCLASGAYSALLGGDKRNYSAALKRLYPTAPLVIRDAAALDFLALPERHREAKLRREIVAHIRDFILEMGKDFLFVDQEYALSVGGEDYRADLLFYHRGLQCLVAVELKTRKFRPADLGQLEFYLEALDRDVRKPNENPSIGIVLCREANRIVVEYAMSRTMSPVMVAQYKRVLVPKEVLQRTFEEYLALPSGGGGMPNAE